MSIRRQLPLFSLLLLVWCGQALPAAAQQMQVQITGIEGELLENVQAVLKPPVPPVREGKVDEFWLARFRRQIPGEVRKAMEPFGFYNTSVRIEEESPAVGDYRFIIHVDPGPQVRVERVEVDIRGPGAGPETLQRLVREFPLRPGDVLRHDVYEEAKGRMEAWTVDLGFLDAHYVTHVIRVSRAASSAEIELILETGPRYTFGEATLEGAPDYPDRFLRRYLAFSTGDIFSFERLGRTQLNFLDSDRFRTIFIHPRREEAKNLQVPIDIQLVPRPPKRLRPGIGYGTDTGARMVATYRDLNLFRRGHEFFAEFTLAEFRQSLGAGYIIPSLRNVDSYTTFRTGYDRENIDIYETRSLFVQGERTRAFAGGRSGTVYLRLEEVDSRIGAEDFTSRLVIPGIRFGRRQYRDVVRPQQGYRYILEIRGTSVTLGSDVGMVQVLAGANALVPLPARLSLFARVQSNTTVESEPLEEIPVPMRFFAGGDQSVRGYAYQSLGPRDATGQVVGGKHLLVGSVELERALGENWGIATFYDAGDAFNVYGRMEWNHAAGLGIRRYTLVGPIKIDIARQIGVPDPAFRLHISVGFGW
jgi:translocation and assembly module TamA